MKFDQTLINYMKSYHRLKYPKAAKTYLIWQHELLCYKIKKLKPGLVRFEYKEMYYEGIMITWWFEMDFVCQIIQKIEEERFKRIWAFVSWANDFKNIGAFLIISLTLLNKLRKYLRNYYDQLLSSINKDIIDIDEHSTILLRFYIKSLNFNEKVNVPEKEELMLLTLKYLISDILLLL
jgi:hypothetical protein